MRRNFHTEQLLNSAEHELRCAYGSTLNERRSLRYRSQHGELIESFANCFARKQYWENLAPAQQTLHICKAVHLYAPQRVFAGPTAAAIHGMPLPHRLHNGTVYCVANRHARRAGKLIHIRSESGTAVNVNGLPVTGYVRTLVDCARLLEFRDALPLFDSVARRGGDVSKTLTICSKDAQTVVPLVRYTDARSENGGESWARATIIQLGFAVPELQVQFCDPLTRKWYRVDFLWRLPDGTMIVGEYDGMAKYHDPAMAGTQTIEQRVQAERERDAALQRCGVARVVHFSFHDVHQIAPLHRMLMDAGVPLANG